MTSTIYIHNSTACVIILVSEVLLLKQIKLLTFHSVKTSHHVIMPHFIYPFFCWWTFILHWVFLPSRHCCHEHPFTGRPCACGGDSPGNTAGWAAGLQDTRIFSFTWCLWTALHESWGFRCMDKRPAPPTASSDLLFLLVSWVRSGITPVLICISLNAGEAEHFPIYL